MAEHLMPTCDKPVDASERPWWVSEDQWLTSERCLCVREPDHEPPCACVHAYTPPRGT